VRFPYRHWASRRVAVTIATCLALAGGAVVSPPAASPAFANFFPTGTIVTGDFDFEGDHTYICSKAACLAMQYDGNLVVYKCPVLNRIWCEDHFYPYAGWRAMWASNTNFDWAAGHLYARFQTDGNLVIYGPGVTPMWASNTCCWAEGRTLLAVQWDGNVVIYTWEGRALWATNTNYRPNT
jgi:hypothetical protein